HLTMDGRAEAKAGAPVFTITEILDAEVRSSPKKKAAKAKAGKKKEKRRAPAASDGNLEKALKAWRLAEAKKQGIPAFRIMTDQTLSAIAAERPQTTNALLGIHGMGLRGVEKYGAAIFRVLSKSH